VLLIISSYIVKEILKENLKELHDSLASADAQFRTELDQSNISIQLITVQQQIENLEWARTRTGDLEGRTTCSCLID
jgi:hypothetical protein